MSADLRRKLIWSMMLVLLLYIGFVLFSDLQRLMSELNQWPWVWLPAVIGLTLVNYVARLLRWHWYLRLLGTPIGLADSARIFGVGMLMVMTPGKAGEFLKSYMVKNVAGAPMTTTAPVILAERMLDGFAMLLLAGAGLVVFPDPVARGVAALTLAGFVAFLIVMQIRPLALWCLEIGARLPVVKKFAGKLHEFYESSYTVFRPRNLLIALSIGLLAWGAEGVAYYVVLIGFGVAPGLNTLITCVFIFCISVVIGAVVATPGGAGGVEGGLIALSTQIFGLTVATATAGALLVRFCTLWLGVGLGIISFFLWSELLAGSENVRREEQPVMGD
ncbi:MAG: lysylphosphatidylglycerol synthase transmembrane domain-containing protein [Caldilineaceae bacterium]